MSKRFVFFQDHEGGMSEDFFDDEHWPELPNWWEPAGRAINEAMRRWAATAEVGEYYDRGCGYLVRLKDE